MIGTLWSRFRAVSSRGFAVWNCDGPGRSSGRRIRAGAFADRCNIPLKALEARQSELDPSQEIVAYCRGPYCVLSYEAVAALRARGFRVRRLQDGFPEWRAAGLPVAGGHDGSRTKARV